MPEPAELNRIVQQVRQTGFPLEHWASSLLRAEGWSVTTNFYYIDSDDKKPREMDIVAFKEKHLEKFKVRTVLLLSCKKAQTSVWGFLRRPFPMQGNQRNLFPVMVTSKVPAINHSLINWAWRREFCEFMASNGLREWFDVPQHDVFAHQQFPLKDGKPHDSDMYSSTMQLIKAQAYEMAGNHVESTPEVTQFNLISLTEGEFVALNFGDDESIEPEEIEEQVGFASYKIDNCDHESRIFYLTKKVFEKVLPRFSGLHHLNVKFFVEQEKKFLENAIFDSYKRMMLLPKFEANIKETVLGQTKSFRNPPYTVPSLSVSLLVEAYNIPNVSIAAVDLEILEAARTPHVKQRIALDLQFLWGYEGNFEVEVTNKI